MINLHMGASEAFARTITQLSFGPGPSPKRARSEEHPAPPSSSAVVDESTTTSNLVRREEGIEKYVQGVLKLRDAAHAKAVEELAAKHKLEADRLRAKAAEPVNEFRVAKQFHIKEAELKSEVRKLQDQLEAERAKSSGMEFAQVGREDLHISMNC